MLNQDLQREKDCTKTLQEKLKKLTNEKDASDKHLRDLDHSLKRCQDELRHYEADNKQKDEQVGNLAERVNQREEQIMQQKEEIASMEDKIIKLEEKIENLREQLKKAKE